MIDPDEFYVERIVAKRSVKNKIEYLIKWHNYPDSDNSWEPLENIYCVNLIDQFERELLERQQINLSARNNPLVFNAAVNDDASFGSNDLCTLKNILPNLFDSDNEFMESKSPDVEAVSKELTTHSHSVITDESAVGSNTAHSRQVKPEDNSITYNAFPENDNTKETQLTVPATFVTVCPSLKGNQYTVERILNKRYDDNGRSFYYLKWKGFPDTENSWEPLENLDCRELVKSFEHEWEATHRKVLQTGSGKKTPSIPSPSSSSNEYVPYRSLKKTKRKDKCNHEEARKQGRCLVMSEDVFGYERGLELKKIIGVHNFANEIFYIVKWKGTKLPDIVPSAIICERNPEKVASFLETRVKVQSIKPVTLEENCML